MSNLDKHLLNLTRQAKKVQIFPSRRRMPTAAAARLHRATMTQVNMRLRMERQVRTPQLLALRRLVTLTNSQPNYKTLELA